MSEFAYMPLSDYEDACDAIRAKTGESGLIKSGDMADAIAAIPSSGGSQITKDTWTLTSDISTSTQGFYYGQNGATWMVDRTFNGLQLFHFGNNSASNNKAVLAVIDNALENGTAFYVCRIERSDGTMTWGSNSSGIALLISAGATITRYKMDYQGV